MTLGELKFCVQCFFFLAASLKVRDAAPVTLQVTVPLANKAG